MSELLTPEDLVTLRGFGGRTAEDVHYDEQGKYVYMGDGKGGEKKYYF